MAHVRTQIRAAIALAVKGIDIVQSRVFVSRVHNLESGDLPALKLYTLNETSEPETLAPPRLLAREMQVNIEIACRASLNLDRDLDTACMAVEEALSADSSLGGLAHDVRLESTEIEFSDGGEKPFGLATMTWVVIYRVFENDLETPV